MASTKEASGLRIRAFDARRSAARCNRGRREAIAFSSVSQSAGSGRGLSARAARSIARSWSSPSFCPRSRNRLVNVSIGGGRSPPSKRKSYHKSLTLFRSSCRFASVALRRATVRARRAFLHAAFNPLRIDFVVRSFTGHLSRRQSARSISAAACLLQSSF